jgi:DoxX-like protein
LKEDALTAPAVRRLSMWMTWAGRVISVLPVFILLSSARWKLTHNPWYVAEWKRIGYAESAVSGIGLVQVACVVLYLIPQTAVLGTVLLTGYLGGAIASYVRMGEPYPVLVPLSTCLLAWAGIYLRERRLRALLPFRKSPLR